MNAAIPRVLSLALALAAHTPAAAQLGAPQTCTLDTEAEALWQGPLQQLLADDLWQQRDAYDAAHTLLVPLHAAYRLPGTAERPFQDLMTRAGQSRSQIQQLGNLNRWQFYYLVSQYLKLQQLSGQWSAADGEWYAALSAELQQAWRETPVKWYNGQTYAGLGELLEWKLATPSDQLARNYHGAVWDYEWYVMAVASDLFAVHRSPDFDQFYRQDLAPTLTQVLRQYLPTERGHLLYRRGVWSDHPDFAYAGALVAPGPGAAPIPKAGATLDSSHATRYAAWVNSWAVLAELDPALRPELEGRKAALAATFSRLIYDARAQDMVRFNNYMDGYNGIYRWNYPTQGEGNGYHPSELSGTPFLGWWGLLGTPEVRNIYRRMAAQFPLNTAQLQLYTGPNTTRERHPLMTWPQAFNGGLLELNTRLAAGHCLSQAAGPSPAPVQPGHSALHLEP